MQSNQIKHMKRQLIPILGVAGLALSGLSAHAQVFNYSDGDLILDFSQSAATADVEVDLGNLASLTSAAQGAGGTVLLGNFTSDLGLAGASVNGLSFSVVGLQNLASGPLAANTLFLTQKQTGASPNALPNDLTASAQNTAKGTIQHIVGIGNSTGILPWSTANAASAYNTPSTAIIGNTSLSSYTKIVGASFSGAAAIGGGAPKNTTSATFATDGGSIVSDLFEFDPLGSSSKAGYEGYFTFNSDGTLDFTTGSGTVPEPATYGIFAGAGLLVVSLRNQLRRKQV
jgi:hypothetical protein